MCYYYFNSNEATNENQMSLLLNSKTNHLEFIQELGLVSGVRLIAIKRGEDQVGFAIVKNENGKTVIGGKTFDSAHVVSLRLFSPVKFKSLKSEYKTTPEFFEAMVSIMNFDK